MQSLIHDDLIVIILLYIKSETIERAVCSVDRQKLQPITIIIAADGAKDNGSVEIRNSQTHHPNLKLIDQEDLGIWAAKNRGSNRIANNMYSYFGCRYTNLLLI